MLRPWIANLLASHREGTLLEAFLVVGFLTGLVVGLGLALPIVRLRWGLQASRPTRLSVFPARLAAVCRNLLAGAFDEDIPKPISTSITLPSPLLPVPRTRLPFVVPSVNATACLFVTKRIASRLMPRIAVIVRLMLLGLAGL